MDNVSVEHAASEFVFGAYEKHGEKLMAVSLLSTWKDEGHMSDGSDMSDQQRERMFGGLDRVHVLGGEIRESVHEILSGVTLTAARDALACQRGWVWDVDFEAFAASF